MRTNRRLALKSMGMLGSLAALTPARVAAQPAFPTRPVKLVMPHAAGGPTDLMARAIAAHASQTLGQQMFVESRVGASGNIGTEFVARAEPDGYTVLYQTSGITIVPALFKKLNYDPLRSFAPVAMPASINVVLLAGPALPVNNFAEFAKHLKANPGKLTYGSGGTGNITHLGVEVLLQALGASAVHVPYKGTAPAMADLLGGQIHFMLDAVSTAWPYVKDRRVTALAVTGAERSPLMPNLPTVRESGLAIQPMATWQCVLAPAGTPPAVVDILNRAVNAAAADQELQRRHAAQGVQLQTSTPAQVQSYMRAEVERWAGVARGAGIVPE